SPALRAGGGHRRLAALSARAQGSVGEGDARPLLRSRGVRRSARSRRPPHVRCRLRRRIFRDGAGSSGHGIRVMPPPQVSEALSAPVRDFVARAKARLSQTPPDKLDAPVSLAELASQYGDHRMASELAAMIADKPFRAAAVLVPVVAHTAPTFLLT